MKKALLLAAVILGTTTLVGCQQSEKQEQVSQMQMVTGTITYRERIALPENAVVEVTLQDVSLADAKARVLSQHRFETNGAQVPFKFELPYNVSEIDDRHRYSVSARIEVNGKLRFITDTSNPVITDNNKSHKIDLRLVGVR
ncbi:YbaY family lipoprotein [Vibrio agarivorans]|uniref:YbaY family lipoprotein n=1 Tax=Vibrio agarivorans TaxID=153622 RepID=UPI00222E82FF|nr:YbaY family lipoprotein [Vibrio agarivorans]MDN3661232.1 YbaY family lipoprotein [Vibrio agarivorans]